MKKLNQILILAIVSVIALMAVNMILAQEEEQPPQPPQPPQQPQQQRQQRQQFDPQQMMERRMNQIIEQLKLSEEETAVLKPMIQNLMNMRMEQSRELRTLLDNLQKAINAKDENQIKTALEAVKSKREAQKGSIEKAEKEMIELLTVVQEANLTVMGVINSDGSGMFMGTRPGGPGQNQPGGGSRQPQGQMRRN